MSRKLDLIGRRFGRLLVIGYSGTKCYRTHWTCRCDCGAVTVRSGKNLIDGDSRSCGCLKKEVVSKITYSHGMANHPSYHTWCGMMTRCYNPKSDRFKDYGGRGIKVCDRWKTLVAFIADMGIKPKGTTLERKNVNGDYSPENCIWATAKEQANNRRQHRWITVNDQQMTTTQAAEILKINKSTLYHRMSRGWNLIDAINRPVAHKTRKHEYSLQA